MFDRKDIEAYKRIKPSPDLKDRIKKSCGEQRRTESFDKILKFAPVVAVCLMLFFVVMGRRISEMSKVEVYVYGDVVSERNIELPTPRTMNFVTPEDAQESTSIPLVIIVNDDARITVDGGIMQVLDDNTHTFINEGMEFTTDESVYLQWDVSAKDNRVFRMKISHRKKTYVYILEFDSENQSWTLGCKK